MSYHMKPTLKSGYPQALRALSPVDVGCSLSGPLGTIGTAKNTTPDRRLLAQSASGPGSRRPSVCEEQERLLSIIPNGEAAAYPDPGNCVQPHADGCPECVVNVETPWLHETRPDGCSTAYECHDCGHSWSTSWAVR
jgi:DNA-directed RNA polymerase subunit M/transcription elongation factor TFIIS